MTTSNSMLASISNINISDMKAPFVKPRKPLSPIFRLLFEIIVLQVGKPSFTKMRLVLSPFFRRLARKA